MTELHCRSCGAQVTESLVDLGNTPLANSYPAPASDPAAERWYPLHALVCGQCFLVQLEEVIPPEEIFSDYAYFSSVSESWVVQCREFALDACDRFGLGADSLVVEIASNDGYLLRHFRERGIAVLGVEPAANVAAAAVASGIPTEVSFFGLETARRLADKGVHADLLVANNVVAHVPDLNDLLGGMAALLSERGTISIEVPHLLNLIEQVQFDTIYHEHYSYLSLLSLEPALARQGLRVLDVEELPTHGGSLRIFAAHIADPRPPGPGLARVRASEAGAGLDRLATYAGFSVAVEACRNSLRTFLAGARARGESVVAYGAAAKGNTLLNSCGVDAEDIAYVVDRSPHKQGRLTPGTRLMIEDPSKVAETRPDWLLVLPWNLLDEIREQMGFIRQWGGRFVTPVPEIAVHP